MSLLHFVTNTHRRLIVATTQQSGRERASGVAQEDIQPPAEPDNPVSIAANTIYDLQNYMGQLADTAKDPCSSLIRLHV